MRKNNYKFQNKFNLRVLYKISDNFEKIGGFCTVLHTSFIEINIRKQSNAPELKRISQMAFGIYKSKKVDEEATKLIEMIERD